MATTMKRLALTVVVFAAIGCGGDDEGGIEGSWFNQLNDGCALAVTFDAKAKSYLQMVFCQLQGGGFGADAEGGRYSTAGNQITFTPTRSSCHTRKSEVETATWAVRGDVLTLGFPKGGFTFDRNTAKAMGGAAFAWGCWDMGKFTPGALRDI